MKYLAYILAGLALFGMLARLLSVYFAFGGHPIKIEKKYIVLIILLCAITFFVLFAQFQ